jgi:predicted PhzF superfamily epimerase YddE/YHI9
VDISSKDGTMLMDFPADPPDQDHVEVHPTNEQLVKILGLSQEEIVKVKVSSKLEYVVIVVDPSVDIPAMKVDSQALVCSIALLSDARVNCSPERSNLYRQSPLSLTTVKSYAGYLQQRPESPKTP